MRANDLIKTLQRFGGNHLSPAEFLTFLNDRQNFILGQNIGFMRRSVDLSTVSGTVEYDLDTLYSGTETVRDVGVITAVPTSQDTYQIEFALAHRYYRNHQFAQAVGNPSNIFTAYRTIPGSADEGGAKLIFDEDPGDTEGLYVVHLYIWPPQLQQVTDLLTIPDQFIEMLRYDMLVYLAEMQYTLSNSVNDQKLETWIGKWQMWNEKFESSKTAPPPT